MAEPTRQEARERRVRCLLLVAANPQQIAEGSVSDKAMRRVRFAVLVARSIRIQTQLGPGWAEKPCPCTLREACVCPLHEADRPLGFK